MRDMASKMAELKFEAPLAQFEETDEWPGADYQQTATSNGTAQLKNDNAPNNINLQHQEAKALFAADDDDGNGDADGDDNIRNDNSNIIENAKYLKNNGADTASVADNFTETFSGSLEDLVNTFDEKITKCFGNYEESVEKLAPVQIRTQEEIMNECQMWWTITGNFGSILPIDWSKTYSRKLHLPSLNLNENKESPEDDLDLSSEDEAVASDLDLHALILNGLHHDVEPLKTADEVIQEIDDMMQDDSLSPDSRLSSDALEKGKEVLSTPLYEDKLKGFSLSQLNELFLELEVLIREFSETLIAELALRDELEYEKELKNTFISLLLSVQNKRRQYYVEKKKQSKSNSLRASSNGVDPKYLTTVIPHHMDIGPPDNQTLQVLIKILKAINEDSPTVPTLLTDYILKVLCPT